MTETNWDFLNHGLSSEVRDEISWSLVQLEWRDLELECRNSCWFDYRFLHPFDATMVFIDALDRVYKDVYRKYRDYTRAEHVSILKPDDLIHSWRTKRAKLVACWKVRMIADQIGMPYEIYLSEAYEQRLRFWKQRFLPQPNALYGEEIVEKVSEAWSRRQRTRLHFSFDPRFLNDRYVAVKAQDDHHEWLLEQAQFRSNPQSALDDLVRRGLIPQQKVDARIAA